MYLVELLGNTFQVCLWSGQAGEAVGSLSPEVSKGLSCARAWQLQGWSIVPALTGSSHPPRGNRVSTRHKHPCTFDLGVS